VRRLVLLPLLFAALVPTAAPGAAQDFWVKAQGSGCQVWSDEAMDNEVVTWSGSCKDGKASGKGKLTWTEDGKPAGSYDGFMEGGKLNGPGKLEYMTVDGAVQVEAIFKNSDVDGGGLFSDAAGNVYEGEIQDGKAHGFGYEKIGEEEYAGEFDSGLRHGIGLSVGPSTAYLGEFDKHAASGSGTLEDAEGGRYHGQFKNNKPHGFGTYVTQDGAVYQGQFVDGKADGQMLVKSSPDAKAIVETWKNGQKVK
jgi:hypothetical protein